jgi:hypothetical protein
MGTSNLTKFVRIYVYACYTFSQFHPPLLPYPTKTINGEWARMFMLLIMHLLHSLITTVLAQVHMHFILHLRMGYVQKLRSYVEPLNRNILWRAYPLLGNDSVNTFRATIGHPLLGNDSVNILPRKSMRATIGHLLLRNGSVNTPP